VGFRIKREYFLLDIVLGILVPCFIAYLALWEVFAKPGFVFWGDLSFSFDFLEWFKRGILIYPWNSYAGIQNISTNLLFTFEMAFLAYLGLSAELVEKLWLAGNYALAGVSMYFAMRILLQKENKVAYYGACVAASICFMINRLAIFYIGVPSRMPSYAVIPLAAAFYIKTLREETHVFRNSAITALLIGFLALYPPHIPIMVVVLGTYEIYRLGTKTKDKKLKTLLLGDLKKNLFIIAVFFMSSVYWMLPYFSSSSSPLSGGTGGVINFENVFTSGITFIDVMTLNLSSWDFFPQSTSLKAVGLLMPITAFLAILLYVKRNNEKHVALFLGILAALAILFASGPKGPLGTWYISLARSIPLSDLAWITFREPGRFIAVISYAYAFLAGLLVWKISEFVRSKTQSLRKVTALAISVLIISGVVLPWIVYSTYPASGSMNGQYTPTEVPSEYADANKWLKDRSGYYRVWWLPYRLEIFLSPKWARTGFAGFPETTSPQPYIWPTGFMAHIYLQDLMMNRTQNLGKILSVAGVKYVILHKDLAGSQWFFPNGDEDTRALNNLLKQKDLELVYNQGFIYIFRNKESSPFMYVPSKVAIIVGGLDILAYLLQLDDFDPTGYAFVFAQQVSASQLKQLLSISSLIVMDYTDRTVDLSLHLQQDEFINLNSYAGGPNDGKLWSKGGRTFMGNYYESEKTGKNYIQENSFYYTGLVGASVEGATLTITRNVEEVGNYDVWIRALKSPVGGEIALYVDGVCAGSISTNDSYFHFQWMNVSGINLTKGSHEFKLENTRGENNVDVLMVITSQKMKSLQDETKSAVHGKDVIIVQPYSEADGKSGKMYSWNVDDDVLQKIEEIPSAPPVARVLGFTTPCPGKYIVTVEATAPFALVMSENFDPAWTITNIKEFTHFPALSFLNGFYIEETGKLELEIEWGINRYFEAGVLITVSSLTIIAILLSPMGGKIKRKIRYLSK